VQKYFNQADTFKDIGTTLKPRMKEYLEDVLPAEILKQPKKGFSLATNIGDESSAQKKYYMESLALIFSELTNG